MLDLANNIYITSGEGEYGTTEAFRGRHTMRAIKARLTRERCGGTRWARAVVFSHSNEWGDAFVDLETGEFRSSPVAGGLK